MSKMTKFVKFNIRKIIIIVSVPDNYIYIYSTLIIMVSIPINIIPDWNTSVQITAFIPPCLIN